MDFEPACRERQQEKGFARTHPERSFHPRLWTELPPVPGQQPAALGLRAYPVHTLRALPHGTRTRPLNLVTGRRWTFCVWCIEQTLHAFLFLFLFHQPLRQDKLWPGLPTCIQQPRWIVLKHTGPKGLSHLALSPASPTISSLRCLS